jgi:flagellar motor switch protein FliN/FliY
MTASSLNREFAGALVEELAIVVGAMIDAPASVVPGAPAMGRQWVAEIRTEGGLDGAVTLVLDHDGTVAVTKLMTGIEGEVPAEALLDTLREVLAQAVGALALKPVARGAKVSVAQLGEQSDRVPEGEWSAHAIAAEKLPIPLSVTVWSTLSVPHAEPAPAADAAPAAASVATAQAAPADSRIEVLLDIDLPLVVRFGRTELPLRQLTRLGPGSVIDLGRSPDDPVEVLVSNRVVARGEVVVVSGSYGIRILDVVSQRERVRSMEA